MVFKSFPLRNQAERWACSMPRTGASSSTRCLALDPLECCECPQRVDSRNARVRSEKEAPPDDAQPSGTRRKSA